MRHGRRGRFTLVLLIAFALPRLLWGGVVDRCTICGDYFIEVIYTATDKVTGEVKEICYNCAVCPTICSICSLPVRNNPIALPDGRFLCARDAKGAVLTEKDGEQTCTEMKEALDRLFSRFVTFPDTNVDVYIVDRVNLMELFQTPGNDLMCPNALGYTQFITNENGEFRYRISLLSALPRAQFKAVCAHEYAHCWIRENLSPQRARTMSRSAQEGFCELVAYLLLQSQNEEKEKQAVLQNVYSRGQINLFVEAEKRFGFNEIIDWMRSGTDAALDKNNLNRVRNVEAAQPAPRQLLTPTAYAAESAPVSVPIPDTFVLRGISWIQNQPLATINNRSFSIGETGRVALGKTNVLIRCLAIATNSARIQIVGSKEEQELKIQSRK